MITLDQVAKAVQEHGNVYPDTFTQHVDCIYFEVQEVVRHSVTVEIDEQGNIVEADDVAGASLHNSTPAYIMHLHGE